MTRQLRHCAHKQAGFSFVELMVVIALIGALSAIALPSLLSGMAERRLKSAARGLLSDLQKARLLAVNLNKKVTVQFSTAAGGTYSIFYKNDSNATVTVTTETLSSYGGTGKIISYGKGKANSLWSPYDTGYAIETSPVPSSGTIIFEPQGTAFLGLDTNNKKIPIPEIGANIYLQNQNSDVCYAASVNQFGGIRLRRFSGSAWE
ncbi:GspH/FimT family pseudopilin [Candidatus Electronema sp. JM]|uniref:GspH/FimT family pseudopilin n=1 Tax=Candidatus Electronema sp. JM TaxID=3401571 RepID=UPI003AA90469